MIEVTYRSRLKGRAVGPCALAECAEQALRAYIISGLTVLPDCKVRCCCEDHARAVAAILENMHPVEFEALFPRAKKS